ncbi:STAS domain-containing protein [Amycolatopsis cihanbeyliensis]|uniref:Anti-sigma B factor antagonist n=1 Tax=Amycolatopsis cihanbeyliensis TaxID=1128664 RepID=A0A542DQQ4_AMYCI|nr:STAS domain-containing protein [Amycolatopsis cihanbeyliensis]TQJ05324.1 anti-sigma B factor antagonist [Amycolatopsis cihanbeyliensis]
MQDYFGLRPLALGWQDGAEPFSVTVSRTGEGCVLAMVLGEIDAITAPRLEHELARWPEGDTTAVVVDLSRVSFCSVGGLRLLGDLLERTNRVGIPLELVVDTHPVRRALACAGLEQKFSAHETRAAALASIGVDRVR